MTWRWTIFTLLLLVALPSILYGRWIKDEVYLQTDSVGKVEFSHYVHMEKGESCGTCNDGSMAFSVVPLVTRCDGMLSPMGALTLWTRCLLDYRSAGISKSFRSDDSESTQHD